MHSKFIYAHLNESVNAWHLNICPVQTGWPGFFTLYAAFNQKILSSNLH